MISFKYHLLLRTVTAPFDDIAQSRLIDRSMIALYNKGCKFPVKKMEKNELRLLIVEDEKKLCDMIAPDLNLPGIDGMENLRELRKENEETKVLIRSARKHGGTTFEVKMRIGA